MDQYGPRTWPVCGKHSAFVVDDNAIASFSQSKAILSHIQAAEIAHLRDNVEAQRVLAKNYVGLHDGGEYQNKNRRVGRFKRPQPSLRLQVLQLHHLHRSATMFAI